MGPSNQVYFEEELKRLNESVDYPVTIICSDLDGLKMINDTVGLVKAFFSILEEKAGEVNG